ncbi:MAG: hypothetical protein ACXWUK_00730, partial [Burkholderiales bacterium]
MIKSRNIGTVISRPAVEQKGEGKPKRSIAPFAISSAHRSQSHRSMNETAPRHESVLLVDARLDARYRDGTGHLVMSPLEATLRANNGHAKI